MKQLKAPWLSRLAWLPVLAYSAVTLLAFSLDPAWIFRVPRWLFPLLNLIFRLAVGLAFAYVAARAYLVTGALPALALGTGMLVLGVGSTVAVHLVVPVGPPSGVAMHALTVMVAAGCLLAASSITLSARPRRLPGSRRQQLAVGYGGGVALLALMLVLVLGRYLPAFFVPGHGQTPLARLVYGVAIAAFGLAAVFFWQAFAFTRLRFFRWYAVGLALIAVGLTILLGQDRYGDLVTWMGRCGQFLGGAYLLVALLQSVGTAGEAGTAARGLAMSLLQSGLPYRPLVESTSEGVIVIDDEAHVLYWNEAAGRLFGYSAVDAFGADLLALVVPGKRRAAVQAALSQAEGAVELELAHRGGRRLPVEVSVYRERGFTVWVVRDISERKAAEAALRQANETLEAGVAERTAQLLTANAQLKAALADKDALLREVHHRVKNNLQMLCDLLYLQMEAMPDVEQHQDLQDAYTRVYAIARLHEQLHQAMQSGRVQVSEYLARLVDGFLHLHPGTLIEVETGSAVIHLDLDRAIHVGLIVSELITNALKHAFPAGRDGTVRVALRETADQIELQVRDNGRGLPADLDLTQPKSLGLRIVHILARRLEATVTVEQKGGTAFILTFPARADPPVEPPHDAA